MPGYTWLGHWDGVDGCGVKSWLRCHAPLVSRVSSVYSYISRIIVPLSPHIFIIIPDPILYYGGVQKVLICSLFNWLGVWWLLPMQLGSPHPPSSLVGSCIMKFAYFKDPLGLFLPLLTAHTNIYAHQTHIYTHQTHTHTKHTHTHTDKPSTQTHTPT